MYRKYLDASNIKMRMGADILRLIRVLQKDLRIDTHVQCSTLRNAQCFPDDIIITMTFLARCSFTECNIFFCADRLNFLKTLKSSICLYAVCKILCTKLLFNQHIQVGKYE